MFKRRMISIASAACLLFGAGPAHSESATLAIAKQYGLGYLQMIVMQDQHLIEKQAKALGLGDIKVNWSTFRSADVMNDALLSGNLNIAALGVPGLATIWSKTKGTPVEVKGLAGMNLAPLLLNTRNPNIKSLKDFTAQDKIAVPAVKISTQALVLQMAAAKIWGKEGYQHLDSFTVSMTHPDAMAALMSGAGEVNTHFASPPFAQKELQSAGVHQVANSTEIIGSDLSFVTLVMPVSFYQANPKLTQAFMTAFKEATDFINKDNRAAAEIYLRVTGDKTSLDETVSIMKSGLRYSVEPSGTLAMFQFMFDIGRVKVRPSDWKEYMLPISHDMHGS